MALAFIPTFVAAAVLVTGAFAGQTCVSASVPLALTNWSQTVSIPRFDSSLGYLTAVRLQLGVHVEGHAWIENMDNQVSTYQIHFSSQVSAARPDTTVIAVAEPVQELWAMLATHDGTIDFGGTSGAMYNGLAVDALPPTLVTLTSPADLALFTGPTIGPGSVTLGLGALNVSSASGPGGAVVSFQTKASATITVCYDYAPAVVSYCPGTNATCPCANGRFPATGCRNSAFGGSNLGGTGLASVSADTFTIYASGLPTGTSVLFFQGTARVNGGSGSSFGDGLMCAGGTVSRLVIKTASGNSAQYPELGDVAISLAGGVTAGAVRTYQAWYRDAAVYCTSDTFNLSQGLEVIWVQ